MAYFCLFKSVPLANGEKFWYIIVIGFVDMFEQQLSCFFFYKLWQQLLHNSMFSLFVCTEAVWVVLTTCSHTDSLLTELQDSHNSTLAAVLAFYRKLWPFCYWYCNVIIGRNLIEANANTGAIQLLGNPSAPTWKSLATIGNPLAPIGKLPTIGYRKVASTNMRY